MTGEIIIVSPGDIIEVLPAELGNARDKFEALDVDPLAELRGPGYCGTIEPIWHSKTVYILGGGPSLPGTAALKGLEGKAVIAVNNAYETGPWPAMLFGDCRWYDGMRNSQGVQHAAALKDWPGMKFHACKDECRLDGVTVVRRRNRGDGLSARPDQLQWNMSSGACAIDLAVHLGAARIILFGFDMHAVAGRHNWHKSHGARGPKFDPYPDHLKPFAAIGRALAKRGVECVNATPGSAIDVFPIVSPADVLP